ncbi:hypothetical protein PF011_g31276 [Phytophthora fragariae]|uniref:Uncharacterized protein n=1 Tax=Phytophthora fragariae TaxID=53985 RepID=A0A6A3GKC2_9STRA|nr:hypothetical protein PF011_g31276 [Phytophthora fragariae]
MARCLQERRQVSPSLKLLCSACFCCDCTSASTKLGPDRKAHSLRVPARASGDCS